MGSSRCYSLLSGCPPRYGLIAVLLPPLWMFSSSRPLRCSRHLCGCPPRHGLVAALFSPRWVPSSSWAHCGALLASVGALVCSLWCSCRLGGALLVMGNFRCSSRFGGCPPRHGLIAVLSLPRWGPPRHGLVAVPLSLWWLPSCSWAHRGALLTSVGTLFIVGSLWGFSRFGGSHLT